MKIILVSSSFRGGGITSYAHEVVNCFARNNEVHVIIGNDEKLPFDRSIAKVHNIESSDCSETNAKKMVVLINNSIKPDVIINSNSILMSLITPYIDDKIRIITVSHSLRYNEADVAGLNSQYADGIIALSTFSKKYLGKQFHIDDDSKISVIYNFVDELQNADEIREKKKKAKRLNIVFAGGTSAPKTPELVYDIMQGLLKTDRDFTFYFMGYHSPTLQSLQPYKSLQDLFKPDPRVFFTGRIPREQAEQISKEANIFLVPSRREGCPMAMIEAMRAGCIIITSDYKNACQEMVVDGESGFIIPHNQTQSFVNRIIDIIDNHFNYASVYDKCYENYINRFSFKPWQEKMVALIENVAYKHITRNVGFSQKRYHRDLKWMKRRMKYNKYHMFFFESLKSAVPFFIKYISSKYGFKN